MEGTAVLERQETITKRNTGKSVLDFYNPAIRTRKSNPVEEKLVAEDNGNFVDYLEWLGMLNGEKILVLPARQHYFYDVEDFEDIKAIVNLRKLNLIRDLDLFLENIYDIMQPGTELIGCFNDKRSGKETSLGTRVYKKMINFLDSRIDQDINKKSLVKTFLSNGFSVIDMTEINGLTYFRIRNRKDVLQYSA
ncbi:MAG TPA: hypothetical protein VJ963_15130 [Bacteroidales bacterium]|nr:hypothetical protein [Bacteroidales bacterium]